MPCPICDQKPMNCDCTQAERRQHAEIEELEEQVSSLRLTDDERLAIQWIVGEALSVDGISIQATLRGLLDRTRDASN